MKLKKSTYMILAFIAFLFILAFFSPLIIFE